MESARYTALAIAFHGELFFAGQSMREDNLYLQEAPLL